MFCPGLWSSTETEGLCTKYYYDIKYYYEPEMLIFLREINHFGPARKPRVCSLNTIMILNTIMDSSAKYYYGKS